jgi:hypothetical protein
MEDFIDWTAEVEEITPAGKLSIIYRSGKYPSDAVGVTVKIPEDLFVTREWIVEQMENNAESACSFWDELDREALMRGKRRAIMDVAAAVKIAGQTQRGPQEVPDGTSV